MLNLKLHTKQCDFSYNFWRGIILCEMLNRHLNAFTFIFVHFQRHTTYLCVIHSVNAKYHFVLELFISFCCKIVFLILLFVEGRRKFHRLHYYSPAHISHMLYKYRGFPFNKALLNRVHCWNVAQMLLYMSQKHTYILHM